MVERVRLPISRWAGKKGMATQWSVSDVKERQIEDFRFCKDGLGIVDGSFSFAFAARPIGRRRYMLKAKSLGECLVFTRHELGMAVCKAAKRHAVLCKVGFGKIINGGR